MTGLHSILPETDLEHTDNGNRFSLSVLIDKPISFAERRDITTFPAAKRAGMNAFRRANLSPSDVHLAQVHDCFAVAELLALEYPGFCLKRFQFRSAREVLEL